jgi:CheY-like chemotaxis protein
MRKQIPSQEHRIKSRQDAKQPKLKELAEHAMTVRKIKVLLVEDNMGVLMGAMSVLMGRGADVLSAVTKEEAVKALAKHKDIELVITDVSYPEKEGMEQDSESGLSFIRHVKEQRPDLRVVAQSSSKEYLKMAMGAGADQTINKLDLIPSLKKMDLQDDGKKAQKVLIISNWKDYASTLKGTISKLAGLEADICNEAGFKLHDKSRYKKLILVEDYEGTGKRIRNLMQKDTVGQAVPVVLLSVHGDENPMENEVILKQPVQLTDLVNELTGKGRSPK